MYSPSAPLGPGGVDVLGNLASKMEQQLKDTEQVRNSFEIDVHMYKNMQIGKKEFVHKLVNYVISFSALNFLAVHVILEIRTALEKGTSMKDATGGTIMEESLGSDSQYGYGIEGFVGGASQNRSGDGGDIWVSDNSFSASGIDNTSRIAEKDGSYNTIKHLTVQIYNKAPSMCSAPTQCIGCGSVRYKPTNFCGQCGYKQRYA